MANKILTLLDADLLRLNYDLGLWQNDTIYALAKRNAELRPQDFAIRDHHRRLSYAQLLQLADGLAHRLAAGGVQPGQRVAVWLSSRIETVVALLACSRNGYICCPSLHRNHTAREIEELLERMRATALIAETGYGADDGQHDIFQSAQATKSMLVVLQLAPPSGQNAQHDPLTFPAHPVTLPEACTLPNTNPDRVVYLAFTSGTTGPAKGVMHSDNTLLSNARALAADWHMDNTSVLYTLSPLSHNLGFGAMVCAIAIGAELVIHDLPKNSSLADRLHETGATFMFGVPVHAMDLLKEIRDRRLPKSMFSKITGFRISGAPVPPQVVAELLSYGVIPQSGYGMTEACSHHYTLPDDDPQLIIGTSGKSCPGYEIKIWAADDPDTEIPTGQVGQIGGRGASLMLGYFDNQIATENSFNADGWFMTGDLGWMDEQGYLRITGRQKDVIIRGGHNIFPAKIEALANSHPLVERAVVVPVADLRLGEKICLIVMPNPGARIDPAQVLLYLHDQGLSKFDMPEYFIAVSDIPLTASGKILKRSLLEQIKSGAITPTPIATQGHCKSAPVRSAIASRRSGSEGNLDKGDQQ